MTEFIKKTCFIIALVTSYSFAQSTPTTAPVAAAQASPASLVPAPPSLNAKAYVLMDANSGKIIAEKNMDEKRPPASLTKIMTLYVISNALKTGQISLNDKVRISEDAWRTGGSRMFLKEGSMASVQELIDGIIIASGNDACVALSEYVAGSETAFVQMMNQTAQQLGMTSTHFTDSTGLPHPDHYTTAHDLAKLARALINNFPQDYAWYKQKWITYNKIKQPNRNRLLWRDPSVDGIKTGHTKAAGYCLISSAKRDGMRLISVMMGTPTDSARANDSQAILNYGFRFYESHELYTANTAVSTPRVWLGKNKTVALGVNKPLYITIPRGQYQNVKATVNLPDQLKAPIEQGNTYGTLNITLNNKEITTEPLIALANDPRAGVWSRLSDHVSLFFSKMIGKA